jgi:hypothetical protein
MSLFAGWVNRSQQDVIEYLEEENRVVREQLGGRRLLFTDGQRRRLAAKAKAIGRKGLFEISTLVFVLSVQSECLAKIIPLGERHLRKAVKEFTEHYHLERNHQGLDNELIEKSSRPVSEGSAVECRERLGGILKHYHRRAA